LTETHSVEKSINGNGRQIGGFEPDTESVGAQAEKSIRCCGKSTTLQVRMTFWVTKPSAPRKT